MNLVKPEFGLIFWMTVTFLIVFFLMKKFAWGPILKMIHEREESIESALASAEKAKEDGRSDNSVQRGSCCCTASVG